MVPRYNLCGCLGIGMMWSLLCTKTIRSRVTNIFKICYMVKTTVDNLFVTFSSSGSDVTWHASSIEVSVLLGWRLWIYDDYFYNSWKDDCILGCIHVSVSCPQRVQLEKNYWKNGTHLVACPRHVSVGHVEICLRFIVANRICS